MQLLGPTNHALVEAASSDLQRFAPVLDGHLAGRTHLVGNRITVADYSMIHIERFKEAVSLDWSPYPRLNDYFERMRRVEHWVRTAPSSPDDVGRKPKAA